MDTPSDDTPENRGDTAASQSDRLDSWKEIATYLGRGVSTVQRWEQHERLPVHRLPHAKRGSVFALKHELDVWRMERVQSGTPYVRIQLTRRYMVVAGGLGLILVALGGAWTVGRTVWRETPALVAGAIVPKPLASDAQTESGPSLSPDGNQVVYHWRREDAAGLYVKEVARGEPRRLPLDDASKFAGAMYPKWSPRGNLIAFLLQEKPEEPDIRGLYLVSPSGGHPRRLTSIAGIGICWPPDGHSLAFADRSTGEPFSIFAVSLDTGLRRRLSTPGPGTFGDTHCAFSPDGRRLAVARYDSRYQADLYVTDIQDDHTVSMLRLTEDFVGILGIDWTPDGKAIVLGSSNGLWVVSASRNAHRNARMITAFGHTVLSPTFSRLTGGSNRLVYQDSIRDLNVWRWHAASGGAETATPLAASTWWETHPAYSPDGRRVAFASNRTGTNEIWTVDANGSNLKQVTFHRGPIVISPQWSPDGLRLAFSLQAAGNRDIYTVHADGSNPTRMTWETSQEENPSWSHDGRWIYFRSDRAGIAQFWKISTDGGNPVRVTTGQASQGFESPDGKFLYFVRRMEVPGVWSVPVDGGKEELVLPDVSEAFWGVAETGIAFLVSAPALSPGGPTVRFFDFASGKISTLVTLTGRNTLTTGFAVSPDGSSVLWTRFNFVQSDLMLIDPWTP